MHLSNAEKGKQSDKKPYDLSNSGTLAPLHGVGLPKCNIKYTEIGLATLKTVVMQLVSGQEKRKLCYEEQTINLLILHLDM